MASALISFITGVVICIACLISSWVRIRNDWHFSFLNHYPYEIFCIEKRVNRIPWAFFCLGLLSISSTGLALLLKIEGLSFTIGNIALSLPFLFFAFLTFLSLYRERWHVCFFLLFSLFSIFMNTSYGYYLLTDLLAQQRAASLVCSIILFVLAGIELCLLINPSLYRYALMKKEKVEDEVILRRPKVIWLAFTEWIIFFLDIISVIVILLAVG